MGIGLKQKTKLSLTTFEVDIPMKTTFGILTAFGLLLTTALQAQDDWTLKSPATKPSVRYQHAIASLGGDQVLLFGGTEVGGANDETWVYDLSDNIWTLKSPATKPSARRLHAMASLGGDQVLLFGAFDQGGGSDDETWVYDLSDNTWTTKNPAIKPSARYAHAMVYLGGDQVLLFGGIDVGGNNDETWVYDLSDNTWTLKNPATKPSARRAHAMASLGGDQVLLFGGHDVGGANDETWVYDLSDNTWTLKSPATQPSARTQHGMASLGGDQVLLFGGNIGGGFGVDETWVYDLSDNTWMLKSLATEPSGRYSHAMASLGGQVLLFGGNASFLDDETWVYTATPAPVTKPFVFLADENVEINGEVNSDGDIHANNDIFFNEGNKPNSLHTGNVTASDDIFIKKRNKIVGTVMGDDVENSGTVTGGVTENAGIAKVPLPVLASIEPGDDDVTVKKGKTLTLDPGDYEEVKVEKKGTLNLKSGTYNLECLNLGEKAMLVIDLSSGDPIILNVDEEVIFGKNAAMKLLPSTASTDLITINSDEDDDSDQDFDDDEDDTDRVIIGEGAQVFGNIIAPETMVVLDKKSRFKGAICAENILVLNGARFVHHSSTASFPKGSEVEESEVTESEVVTDYVLEQNYPNPFSQIPRFAGNPSTEINFQLPAASDVKLVIYSLTGQVVRELVNGVMPAGRHAITWNGRNHAGEAVAGGVYLYRLIVERNGEAPVVMTRKLTVLK